jgi:hypothetical protein
MSSDGVAAVHTGPGGIGGEVSSSREGGATLDEEIKGDGKECEEGESCGARGCESEGSDEDVECGVCLDHKVGAWMAVEVFCACAHALVCMGWV